MKKPRVGIIHYSAPPVIGGVEAVMQAQAQVLLQNGYAATMIAGAGEQAALPEGCQGVFLPLLDSQHPDILQASQTLEAGRQPENFQALTDEITAQLEPVLAGLDRLIVHNIFSKHFNLPLTAALFELLEQGRLPSTIAWTHDLTWTSPNSRHKVHEGYPWDLLRRYDPRITWVAVSERRQAELVELMQVEPAQVHVIYNGVDPDSLLGLSPAGRTLIDRLDLLHSDLILLMPVRVTQAKNIEYALEVLHALQGYFSNPRLVLTGPPDPHSSSNMAYFESLKEKRRELGLEDQMSFVYESGPRPHEPYTIGEKLVGDLYRISDLIFMPSHREGFGMPVLEAGLAGVPIVCTSIPAAEEIGEPDVTCFDPSQSPQQTAALITGLVQKNPLCRFRRRVRLGYTWQALFEQKLAPLLEQTA